MSLGCSSLEHLAAVQDLFSPSMLGLEQSTRQLSQWLQVTDVHDGHIHRYHVESLGLC